MAASYGTARRSTVFVPVGVVSGPGWRAIRLCQFAATAINRFGRDTHKLTDIYGILLLIVSD